MDEWGDPPKKKMGKPPGIHKGEKRKYGNLRGWETGARMGGGLERIERFVEIYLADPTLNATKAAAAAGYGTKPSTAGSAGNRLLKSKRVKALIAAKMSTRIRKLELTADAVLQGLAQIAFGNMMDFGSVTEDGGFKIDLRSMDRAAAGAIAAITSTTEEVDAGDGNFVERTTTTIKMADRRPALEALAKYFKLIGNDREEAERETIQLVIMGAPERPMVNITPEKEDT